MPRKAKEDALKPGALDGALVIYTDGACSGNPGPGGWGVIMYLSLIHISEPTRQEAISYAVFCLKKKR